MTAAALTRGWRGDLQALAAGALLPFSFSPYDLWPLGLIGSAWLAWLLEFAGRGRAWWRSYLFGLGLFGVGASWVYVSIHVYGYAPMPLAVLMTGVFVAGLALVFALPFYPYVRWLRGSAAGLWLGFAAIWLLGEWLRSWLLTGFPWLYLGYGQMGTWLAGWFPVGGVWAASLIAALSASSLALALHGFTRGIPSRRWLFSALATSALLWSAGLGLTSVRWTEPAGEPFTVALVQPSLPLEMKWDPRRLVAIQQRYLELTAPLWAEHDLVIWPESAVPDLMHRLAPWMTALELTAQRHGSALITGVPTQDAASGQFHNSLLGLGRADGLYHKHKLVPFGEYVPLEQWLRGLIRFFDLPMSNFSAGAAEQPPLRFDGLTVAPLICYEVVYPDFVAAGVSGAGFLLTVSNDTWFGTSAGPHQHLQMARARALETGRWLLRGTNDGITVIVDHRGEIVQRLPQFEPGVLSGSAQPRRGQTPFMRTGVAPWLGLALALALAGVPWRRRQP